jgi:hypothetical protein
MLASFSPVRSPAEQDICHLNGIAGARFFVRTGWPTDFARRQLARALDPDAGSLCADLVRDQWNCGVAVRENTCDASATCLPKNRQYSHVKTSRVRQKPK